MPKGIRGFIKGNIPWNKGKPLSEEAKRNLSLKLLGRTVSKETRKKLSIKGKEWWKNPNNFNEIKIRNKKISIAHKDKILSEETKRKISEGHKGMKYLIGCSDERKRKISEANKGKKRTIETKEKISNSKKGTKSHRKGICYIKEYGKEASKKIRIKISKSRKGKCLGDEHHNWNGGTSFEPYGVEFNKELKEQIRKRDNFTCQRCKKLQNKRLQPIHHIDYNKKNNNQENLITLCRSCHMKTNFNREKWKKFFTFKKMAKSIDLY